MPKNTDALKSEMRSKSTRKPPRDVSNAKIAIKFSNSFKKPSEEDGGQPGGDSLDRLLLLHSDLSSLLRQIDELVVQGLQLTSNKGRKEIKQFADMLWDMQASLKPWVPKLQKALCSQPTGPENKSEQSVNQTVVSVPKESTNAVIESPEQTKWESLVSPSPLVSWRAECNTEGGRQLFLLTPLPERKAFSSKLRVQSLPALEEITCKETAHPISLFNSVGNMGDDLPEGELAKAPANKILDIEVDKAVGNLQNICASPANNSRMNCSMFVMTPCLKTSPPKSCTLLEPISEFSRKKNEGAHRSTPFPAGVQISDSSESVDTVSYSCHSSDDLKEKYPELCGINAGNLGSRMVGEESPNWIVSPPKTCAIMEPPDEILLKNLASNCLLARTTAVHNQHDESEQQCDLGLAAKSNLQDITGMLDLAESTPMVKEPMSSSFRMRKHPGENTLKKELWTKFEAASSHGIRFDASILHNVTKKGFLDRLEEASDP